MVPLRMYMLSKIVQPFTDKWAEKEAQSVSPGTWAMTLVSGTGASANDTLLLKLCGYTE